VLMRRGAHEEALKLFERLRDSFAELGMAHEVAYVSVDMAEALLVLNREPEVAPLCRSAMGFFAEQSITSGSGALTALAYLQETASSGSLTPSDVSQVRGFFDSLKTQPTLLFAKSLPEPPSFG